MHCNIPANNNATEVGARMMPCASLPCAASAQQRTTPAIYDLGQRLDIMPQAIEPSEAVARSSQTAFVSACHVCVVTSICARAYCTPSLLHSEAAVVSMLQARSRHMCLLPALSHIMAQLNLLVAAYLHGILTC